MSDTVNTCTEGLSEKFIDSVDDFNVIHRLRRWKIDYVNVLDHYIRRSGAESALRTLMHSQYLRADELIALGKLNSLAVYDGWYQAVNLATDLPEMNPDIRPLLGEIFRPEGFPKHIRGDIPDMHEAFSLLVEISVAELQKAIQKGDDFEAEKIRTHLSLVGVTADPETSFWQYSHPNIDPYSYESPHNPIYLSDT